MASPISCKSIFLLPLIATSLFFQVSNATFEVKADQALIDSICEQTQDVDFCKSTFNADPRTPAADRDGLGLLSIAINIDVVQATIDDTIPRLLKLSLTQLISNEFRRSTTWIAASNQEHRRHEEAWQREVSGGLRWLVGWFEVGRGAGGAGLMVAGFGLRWVVYLADRDGLVVLSIAINIDVVQATINDTIPEIVKTLIDPVDKQRIQVCLTDYNDALVTLIAAFTASSEKNYKEVIGLVTEAANKIVDCDGAYRKSPPIREPPISGRMTK
ncbi:pectinesterase inhibitor 5-like [Fagus crenata]